jgi:hypothetical protein
MSDLLRIDKPGIYSLTAAQYHADPCIEPSFSRSIGKLLIDASPMHAHAAHPRLGAGPGDDELAAVLPDAKEDRDTGTAAHSMFLRGEQVAVVVEFDSYATKAAKAARDEILAAGKVPLKRTKYDDTMRMVDALERWRARTGAFTKGKPEQTLIWQEGPVWCRCMVDWLPDDPAAGLWDLKTTGRATARSWSRQCFDGGSDLQAAFYPRGAAQLRGGEVPGDFGFCVVENKPPFGVKVFGMSPSAIEMAEGKIAYALDTWALCRELDVWPNYPDEVEWIDAPVYALREWDWRQRQAKHQALRGHAHTASVVDKMIEQRNWAG